MHHAANNSTRDRVLEYIKMHGPVSVKALTDEVGITPMAIRGHLSKLEKDELIEVETVRQKLGRPLQVFRLTSKGEDFFPKHYDRFAVELLKDIQALDNGKTLKKLKSLRTDRIADELKELFGETKKPVEMLKLYYDYLEAGGNMPDLIKVSEKIYRLHINNCPLASVVLESGFCCDSEIQILQKIFEGFNVTKVSPQGTHTGCCYQFDFH